MLALNSYIRHNIKKHLDDENNLYEENSKLMVKMINEFLLIKIFNKKNIELEKSKKIMKNHPKIRVNVMKYQ
jgi:hypothetical protein